MFRVKGLCFGGRKVSGEGAGHRKKRTWSALQLAKGRDWFLLARGLNVVWGGWSSQTL